MARYSVDDVASPEPVKPKKRYTVADVAPEGQGTSDHPTRESITAMQDELQRRSGSLMPNADAAIPGVLPPTAPPTPAVNPGTIPLPAGPKPLTPSNDNDFLSSISDLLDVVTLNPAGMAGTAVRKGIENPVRVLENAPAGLSGAASLVHPVLAPVGGAVGKAIEIKGKRLLGDKSSTTPKVPFTDMEVGFSGLPKEVSDMAGEAIMQGIFEIPGLAVSAAKNTAPKAAQKALGFTKAFLNNKTKAKQAGQAAETMLDEGVIKPTSKADEMLERVQTLQQESGGRIGQYLKSQGSGFNKLDAAMEIEKLRPPQRGGEWDKVHAKIDHAVETILGDGSQTLLGFDEANRTKRLLQDMAKFATEKNPVDEDIANTYLRFLDDSLDNVSQATGRGEDFAQFLKDKKVYRATINAEKGLYNRISSAEGNKSIGLTDWISLLLGAFTGAQYGGAQAVGGVVGAYFFKKAAETYGPQVAASLARQIAKGDRTIIPTVLRAIQAKERQTVPAQ